MKKLHMAALIAVVAVAGCAKDPEPAAVDPNANAATTTDPGGPAPNTLAYFNQVVGDRVFFDTDQYDLDGEDRLILDRQAEWLLGNPGTTIVVEGHADERGTRQYNLALGARRANAARSYLVGQGVPANRVEAVTYGKERPEALCSDESCWSQNRRAVTVVTGAPVS